MSTKAADQLVSVLMNWKVKHVFGLPGDSIDTTVDALRRNQEKIKFVQVRHEEVAALSAAANAKLTGGVGVCLAIGGPGAIHLLNGLYDAKMDHVPVLALLGQVTTKDINEGYFQEVNTPKLFDDVAVFNKTISASDNLGKVVDSAIRAAMTKKGVAVLTIPDDLPDHKVANEYKDSAAAFKLSTPQVDDEQLAEAISMVQQAQKPLALIGKGGEHARAELQKFVETNNIPFILTMPAKGTIADDHANSLGNVGKLGTKPAYEAMKSTDLLLMIGTNYPYTPYLPDAGQAKCIQIDTCPENLGSRYAVDLAIDGDAGAVVSQLNAKGALRSDDRFLKACQKDMDIWNKWMSEKRSLNTTPASPEAVFASIDETAPKDAVYSIDVGTSTSWGARFLHVQPTQKYSISAWLGTMGCGLPSAIAGAESYPERKNISVSGDGAFAMVMQDFVTAVKYKLPIIQVVINNQKLAFIEYEQQSAGQLNYEIDLEDMDYAKFAEAAGGVGYTARSNAEFKDALEKAYKETDKPVLINVYVKDNAPLPGKIVGEEAMGYTKYGTHYLENYWKIPSMPPLKDIMRQFF
ncbi:pyruvate oxidase [Bifidobacterium aquikefiri]|uniref:pyruvate oxidase n=1 Tax=Bifidobacterium aquikefiri TaxID=1653207 RepID=UPI0039E78771